MFPLIQLFLSRSLQSMVLIAPKLSESTVNSQLLKYFAKCQLDEQVGWGAGFTGSSPV